MRVVIAGGSGILGRHLARALLADGWDVDILTRDVGTCRAPPAARVPASGRLDRLRIRRTCEPSSTAPTP